MKLMRLKYYRTEKYTLKLVFYLCSNGSHLFISFWIKGTFMFIIIILFHLEIIYKINKIIIDNNEIILLLWNMSIV